MVAPSTDEMVEFDSSFDGNLSWVEEKSGAKTRCESLDGVWSGEVDDKDEAHHFLCHVKEENKDDTPQIRCC